MKRIISAFLTFALSLCLCTSVFAATSSAEHAADILYNLGVFKGNGTAPSGLPNYELDTVATRTVAVTMLVRLLGKEDDAQNHIYALPFTDVPTWAIPYVGYAYENHLTAGISNTAFGGNNNLSATMYLTFLLRALGYNSSTDFAWDKAWELSDAIGMTSGQYDENSIAITRGDVVLLSAKALETKLKGESKTLLDKLKSECVVPSDASFALKSRELVYSEFKELYEKGSTTYKGEASHFITDAFVTKLGDGYKFTITVTGIEFSQYAPFPAGLTQNARKLIPAEDAPLFEQWNTIKPIKHINDTYSFFLPASFAKYTLPNENAAELVVRFFPSDNVSDPIIIFINHSSLPQ